MEKRAAFRFPTDLAADCRSRDRSWQTRLYNVSTTGCMMVCPDWSLPDDERLRLRIKGLAAIDAEIVWQHKGHAGVRFAVPLEPAAMEHLGFDLPEPAPRRQPASARPPSGLHGDLVKRGTGDELDSGSAFATAN